MLFSEDVKPHLGQQFNSSSSSPEVIILDDSDDDSGEHSESAVVSGMVDIGVMPFTIQNFSTHHGPLK